MQDSSIPVQARSRPQLDEADCRRIVAAADINVLRIALYQQTKDPDLASVPVVRQSREGSPFENRIVPPEYEAMIRDKAARYLMRGGHAVNTCPDRQEAEALMQLYAGEPLDQADLDYGWEDLAFEGFPRGADWGERPSRETLDRYSVLIVGAGFSGLLAGIQLDRLGISWRIIERQAGVGGTWFLNDYPEARVDVTSFLYQFKFEQGYPWKSYFATQGELREYFDFILDKYDLRRRISLNTVLDSAQWDEAAKKWRTQITGPAGRETLESDFLVSASGQFSTPKLPDIEGIGDFRGRMFHTTAWDHDYDYTGKRVAIIGTGSTGSQLTRGVAAKAASVTIYQRTPNWLTRVPGYRDKVPADTRWLLDNFPGYANWHVFGLNIAQKQMDGLHDVDHDWRERGGKISERNDQFRESLKRLIRKKVGSRQDLAEKLVPDYAPLSRRLVVSNDWYETLLNDHVELVSGGIRRFTETGIVSEDGSEREFDLVVLGAGFDVEKFLWPVDYKGRDGATLEDLWQADGARAYLTMLLPGFPNFIMMYGPNAGILSGSFHSIIELYTRYFCRLITRTIESGAQSFEVRRDAFDAYNASLDQELSKKLFEIENGGGGYYMNGHGRPGVSMPWTIQQFYRLIREPDFDAYTIE